MEVWDKILGFEPGNPLDLCGQPPEDRVFEQCLKADQDCILSHSSSSFRIILPLNKIQAFFIIRLLP
jgi:hypothetical protein